MKRELLAKLNFSILCWIFSACLSVQAQEVTIFAHQQKPYQYLDDNQQLKGFSWQLIRAMFERADIAIENNSAQLLPFARAYKRVQRKTGSALFMTVRKQKREQLFKWVGPLVPREKWLYKLKSKALPAITTLEQAKDLRVGSVNNSSTHEYLNKLAFKELTLLANENLVFGMFLAGRIDLMPSLELSMAYTLQERGYSYDDVEKVIAFDKRYQYYLAFNKETDQTIIDKLQHALEQMKADGSYSELQARYL
ncbi:MAG: substrate-binding periplasmic protein [Pseudomonadales bacterium]